MFAAAGAGCGNTWPTADWQYISPVIFQPGCATQTCHSRAAAVAGLDFSDADRGYKSLTRLWVWIQNPTAADLMNLDCGKAPSGETVCEKRLRPLVTPYDPKCYGHRERGLKTRGRMVSLLVFGWGIQGCGDPTVPEHPTWAEVQPILQGECNHCHGSTAARSGGGFRLSFFDMTRDVCGEAAAALTAGVLAGAAAPFITADITPAAGGHTRMPPAPGPALHDWERETLLRWAHLDDHPKTGHQ